MAETKAKKGAEIVIWEKKYATGVALVDSQHHQLVDLTNQLYNACRESDDELQTAFKEAMSQMVKYVRFHFDAELKILKAAGYPDYDKHKKMHEDLVRKILDAVNDYNEGKKFVANNFVRTLKDWVFGHIAVYDKQYSLYVHDLIRRGILTVKQLNEFEKAAG